VKWHKALQTVVSLLASLLGVNCRKRSGDLRKEGFEEEGKVWGSTERKKILPATKFCKMI